MHLNYMTDFLYIGDVNEYNVLKHANGAIFVFDCDCLYCDKQLCSKVVYFNKQFPFAEKLRKRVLDFLYTSYLRARRTLELGTIGPKDFTDLSLLFWRLN